MKVIRINHANDDLAVVNSARCSFDKVKTRIGSDDVRLIKYLAEHGHFTPFSHVRFGALTNLTAFSQLEEMLEFMGDPTKSASMKLQKRNRGWYIEHSLYGWATNDIPINNYDNIISAIVEKCPYSILSLLSDEKLKRIQGVEPDRLIKTTDKTVLIEAPLFVLRQLMKSTIGCTYNEVSRRYVDFKPTFYTIDQFKARPDKSMKQGAGDFLSLDKQEHYKKLQEKSMEFCATIYEDFLIDVAPEESRAFLSQNMMSKVWLTASEEAFDRILGLRKGKTAQTQIRELMDLFEKALKE